MHISIRGSGFSHIEVGVLLSLFGALPLSAQQRCETKDQVGYIGIEGLECSNCEMGPNVMRFSTEPRITEVEAGSPASGQIKPGDVIVSLNGSLITTSEGGSKLASLKPGQRITLVIRRDGQILARTFENLPGRCPTYNPAQAAVATASGRRELEATIAGSARETERGGQGQGGTYRRLPTTGNVIRPSQRGSAVYTPGSGQAAATGAGRLQMPGHGFGFSIACSDCMVQFERPTYSPGDPIVWEFRTPPEIYSVEANSTAWRAGFRRGDILTHIDGVDITKAEGGARFGAVKAGQQVRFTVRRDGDLRNFSIRAESARLAPTRASLTHTQQLLAELERHARVERNLLNQSVARLNSEEHKAARELVERLRRDQTSQDRQLVELRAELAKVENRIRETTAYSIAEGQLRPTIAEGAGSGASPRTVRYAGKVGNTDVEVRGASPVVVNESEDEVVIQVGNTTVRIKKR